MNAPALTSLCTFASISLGHDRSCDFWMEITRILILKLTENFAKLFSKMVIEISSTLGPGEVG